MVRYSLYITVVLGVGHMYSTIFHTLLGHCLSEYLKVFMGACLQREKACDRVQLQVDRTIKYLYKDVDVKYHED